MTDNDITDVFIAFEMLQKEIETEIDLVNRVGTRALERRDYKSASKAIERANQVTTLLDKVMSLRKESEALTTVHRGNQEEEAIGSERHNPGRLQRGLRTPEEAYYQPILKALNESGGSARINNVLIKVENSMRGRLKQVDYEPLSSDPEMPRWRNAAQWARNSMVKEGLLKSDSPWGIWEITDAGRMALAKEAY